jgi:hypothetical protein
VIALDIIVLGLAVAIFIGTLRLDRRPRSESSTSTRGE